jgi:hypothetical protein
VVRYMYYGVWDVEEGKGVREPDQECWGRYGVKEADQGCAGQRG